MVRTLLVPLDNSEFGELALPVAMTVARAARARIQLAHVHRADSPEELCFGVPSDLPRWNRDRDAMERLATEMRDGGVPTQSEMLIGPVAERLASYARRIGADLVVMATHGSRPAVRLSLGSVADALVRRIDIPVLLVRPDELDPPRRGIRHMLVPLDGSREGESILPVAIEWGRAMRARFTLLRVIDSTGHYDLGPDGVVFPCQGEGITRRIREEARAKLDRIAAWMRAQELAVDTRIADDLNPVEGILREARELGCDLIALASPHRSGLARLLTGSTARSIVARERTPVLIQTVEGTP